MKFKPLKCVVVLKEVQEEKRTKSGLIIPENIQKPCKKFEVKACGPGTKDEAMEVAEGDIVIAPGRVGTPVEVDGETLVLVQQSQILTVIS